MMRMRRILSPIYRSLVARFWQLPFMYERLLNGKEAAQLKTTRREAKKLISDYRHIIEQPTQYRSQMNWAVKCPIPAGEPGKAWGDLYFANEIANALRNHAQNVRIDETEFFNNQQMFSDDVVLVIRGLEPFRPQKNKINILWVISHPELVSKREILSYDLVFAASYEWANKKTQKYGKNVYPLLQATNPNLFNTKSSIADSKPGILFIGNSRNKFRKIVKDALKLNLKIKVVGKNWEKFIPHDLIDSKFIENNKLSAEYRAATIILNDHWKSMRKNGFISNRLFDAVASGARVISDPVKGMNMIFGRSVQTYGSLKQLKYLTSADAEVIFGTRQELDEQACIVHENESFDKRVTEILQKVQQLAQ